jgi:hypothetical protein
MERHDSQNATPQLESGPNLDGGVYDACKNYLQTFPNPYRRKFARIYALKALLRRSAQNNSIALTKLYFTSKKLESDVLLVFFARTGR